MEGLYIQHRAMIADWARRYHNAYGIEFEELQAQGNLIFCESYHTYDDSTAEFGTHLYHNLRGYLARYCRERKVELKELQASEDGVNTIVDTKFSSKDTYCYNGYLQDALKKLSAPSREIIDFIFSPYTSKKLRECRIGKTKQWKKKPLSRYQLRIFLIKHKNWPRHKVEHCFHEIEQMLISLAN